MSLINFILDVAALLLWLNWRALGLARVTRPTALSLVSTLKRAEPRPPSPWPTLAGLASLIVVRSLFYAQVGPALHWTPAIAFGAVTLHFQAHSLGLMFVFSIASFLELFVVFHLWLMPVGLLNQETLPHDPIQKLVRHTLGPVGRWPWPVQILAVPAAGILLAWLGHWPAVHLGLIAPAASARNIWHHGLILGAYLWLTWEIPLLVVLAVHTVNSFVYVGPSPLWNYLAHAGQQLLRPLRPLPLTAGRVDLRPVAGFAVVAAAGHYGAQALAWWVQHPF